MAALVTPVKALAHMMDLDMMQHQLATFSRGLKVHLQDATDERESLEFQLNAEAALVENVQAAARVGLMILARQTYAGDL